MKKSTEKPRWIIGIDEVGRGPLAGPVTVCAVAMPYEFYNKNRWVGLTDSKKLPPRKREVWHIKARQFEKEGSIRIALASKSAQMIDVQGISVCIASCIAMCLQKLSLDPCAVHVLLDGGLKAPKEYLYQETVVRGDQLHKAISLASVVAKVTRDAYMTTMAKKYPGYDWEKNKGYGTQSHQKALKKLYSTRLHRKSFLYKILHK